MDLRHLKYFVTVAEEENVTRAAARLHMSQPPLSRRIRDLEETLGFELFERKARSFTLTEKGRVFLAEARAVLDQADKALQVATLLASGGRPGIRIGYAPSLALDILPAAIRRFGADSRTSEVHLHDMSTAEMLDGLRSAALDVALMIRPVGLPANQIKFKTLRKLAICVAMHPEHHLTKAPQIGLAEVAKERLIAYSNSDYPEYHEWLSLLFRDFPQPPRIGEEHDSATSLTASVEAGRGIALVQQGFSLFCGSRLTTRPLEPPPPPFEFVVAWQDGNTRKSIADFVQTMCAGNQEDGP